MSRTIARHCPRCKQYGQMEILKNPSNHLLNCPHCGEVCGGIKNPHDIFDYCPMCDCRQFYLAKDFNQSLGCVIMIVGIILVPWSYGLSLPVFAFFDWLLYRRVSAVIICYRCGSEFRGFDEEQKRFKPFLHGIGLKYDQYR